MKNIDKNPTSLYSQSLAEIDKTHLYHPYSSIIDPDPTYIVKYAENTNIHLQTGEILTDAMSSWWAVIHGYNHPIINKALEDQISKFSHIMFGSLTHEPATKLAQKLLDITDDKLTKIFYSDSGSVAIEVSLKMAIQYWYAQGKATKNKILTVKRGYHGDTFAAMSLCDPDSGMHNIFSHLFYNTIFTDAPPALQSLTSPLSQSQTTNITENIDKLAKIMADNHNYIAAMMIEPIVQNAGGLRFYSPLYLQKLRELCDQYNILLIFDEIATGFGRTGKMFAYEHANICPDILCIGKALTAGYITMAATMTTNIVANGIYGDKKLPIMHGPTFMANPLAATAAATSIDLLLSSNWQEKIRNIENWFHKHLSNHHNLPNVTQVRILGAIAVIELDQPINLRTTQKQFIEMGVWIRPFRNLFYIIPPYTITEAEIEKISNATLEVISSFTHR